MRRNRIDFERIARAALGSIDHIVPRWLPDGKKEGSYWVALNPLRNDKKRGSFKTNLSTGQWGDWSVGVRGGDLISLAAYLENIDQAEAARAVARMLGMSEYE